MSPSYKVLFFTSSNYQPHYSAYSNSSSIQTHSNYQTNFTTSIVNFKCASFCREIKSDEKRLTQILLNLLSNALKFTFEGFIKVIVCVVEKDDGSYLHFDIQDTGIGIKTQDFPKLFKSFGMIQSSQSFNASG
jgi:signal transduction histidine kinase